MYDNRKYRFIIIGAGFSKLAGLNLGEELFDLIVNESKRLDLCHIFEKDIENYSVRLIKNFSLTY